MSWCKVCKIKERTVKQTVTKKRENKKGTSKKKTIKKRYKTKWEGLKNKPFFVVVFIVVNVSVPVPDVYI